MKAAAIVGLVLASVVAHPAFARPHLPRLLPSFQRNCAGPNTWAAIKKCTAIHAPNADIRLGKDPHSHVILEAGNSHIFAEFGKDQWQLVRTLGVQQTFVVSPQKDVTYLNEPARRFDLDHRTDFAVDRGPLAAMYERTSFVCPQQRRYCAQVVIGCTVMIRGKATETFRGTLVIEDSGTLRAEGDRSQTSERCRNR